MGHSRAAARSDERGRSTRVMPAAAADTEMLAHELREWERRALDAEREVEELKKSGGGTTDRSARLRTQVAELEDRTLELEKELRAAKRVASKVERLEKDLEDAEAREVAHAEEMRKLRSKMLSTRNELEDLQMTSPRSPSPPPPLRKTGSRLVRSPRQASIPKMGEDGTPLPKAEEPEDAVKSPRSKKSPRRIKSPRSKESPSTSSARSAGKLRESLLNKWE